MSTIPLTRRQRDILDFLQTYLAEQGISPTLEEIAQHFGVNRVTVFGHVREMERKGVLKRGAPGASRTLRPTTAPPSPARRSHSRSSVSILGSIAAGAPIEAIESPESMDLTALLPADKDVYALRVRGDSMIEDAIRDGDIVIVERTNRAPDGATVVAVLEDEVATLKRIYREPGGFRLQPANREMSPLHVRDVEVRGIVIGVVRQLR